MRRSITYLARRTFAVKPGDKIIGSKLGQLITAKEVMKGRKDVVKVSESASVEEAAEVLNSNNIGAVLCSSGDFGVSGVFSERDMVRVVGEKMSLDMPVKAVMTPANKLIMCEDTTTVEQMISMMLRNNIRHIGVRSTKTKKMDGFLSIKDCVGALCDETEVGAYSMRKAMSQSEFAKMGVGAAFRAPTSTNLS